MSRKRKKNTKKRCERRARKKQVDQWIGDYAKIIKPAEMRRDHEPSTIIPKRNKLLETIAWFIL